MADKKKLALSRRQLLGGLGAVGVASAGAGLGTTALFSDEEEFENNEITAGTLNMGVYAAVVATNPYWSGNIGIAGVADDNDPVTGLQVENVLPGDWAIIQFVVAAEPETNPFYVTIHGENGQEREGDTSQPEQAVDTDTTDKGWESVDDTNAELGDKLLMSYWEQWSTDPGREPPSGTDRTDLRRLDNITNTETNQFYTGARGDLPDDGVPDEDGFVRNSPTPAVGYTDFREFLYGLDQDTANSVSDNDPLGNGFGSGDGILVGGTSDPVEVGSDDPAEISRPRMADFIGDGRAELVFYLLLELPIEVGNEIQGDGVRFDLRFSAEQVRNNDDPRSG